MWISFITNSSSVYFFVANKCHAFLLDSAVYSFKARIVKTIAYVACLNEVLEISFHRKCERNREHWWKGRVKRTGRKKILSVTMLTPPCACTVPSVFPLRICTLFVHVLRSRKHLHLPTVTELLSRCVCIRNPRQSLLTTFTSHPDYVCRGLHYHTLYSTHIS